jgi:glutamate-ammonia-ligase adenylyltransferase
VLAQDLCLKHAHTAPALVAGSPADILARARSLGFLAVADAASLLAADQLYLHVTQVLRAILGGDARLAQASDAVKRRLATALDLPSFGQLEAEILETEAQVRAIFNAAVG